jgi:hypothetical protein
MVKRCFLCKTKLRAPRTTKETGNYALKETCALHPVFHISMNYRKTRLKRFLWLWRTKQTELSEHHTIHLLLETKSLINPLNC